MKFRKLFLMIIWFFATAFSKKEFKRFLNDDSGGLVLSFDGFNLPDKDYFEYKLLKMDNSVKSILPEDLPKDFCAKACRLVDEFHRKTVGESVEWMLYFDYTTGEVIYCWKGGTGESGGDFNRIHFFGRSIASIHNHPVGYYSFPSPENFDILENDYEDFEIIASVNAYWVVEFKGSVSSSVRNEFLTTLSIDINELMFVATLIGSTEGEIHNLREDMVGNYLLMRIDKSISDIDLNISKAGLLYEK